MFGDIADFLELDFFNEHRTGDLYVNNVHRGLQILAILEVEAYQSGLYRMPVDYPEEKRAYIDEINEFVVNAAEDPALSIWQDAKTGRTTPEGDPVGQIGFYTIGTEDKLAVLSTCTFRITNGRHLLICRITDEVYEDPYHADPPRRQTKNYDKVGAANRNTRLLWMIMIVLIILAAAVKVTGRANKKKMRALKREKEKKSNKSNY